MGLSLGARRLIELTQKLEDLGRAGDLHNARDLVRELEGTFSQTKAQLLNLRNEEISKLSPTA
jgi:hypothetical protein